MLGQDLVAPTGISLIDECVNGGLPRAASYIIKGPTLSGKTILGMQIQYAALRRGEPCLFVSFGRSYKDVLNYYRRFFNIDEFIKKGNFRFLDLASARHDTSIYELQAGLSEEEKNIVDFMKYPEEANQFHRVRNMIGDKMGWVGVDVIDASSDKLHYTKKEELILGSPATSRQKFAVEKGAIGIHIYTTTTSKENIDYCEYLENIEDGTIELDYDPEYKNRRLRLLLKNVPCNPKWHSFEITKKGLVFTNGIFQRGGKMNGDKIRAAVIDIEDYQYKLNDIERLFKNDELSYREYLKQREKTRRNIKNHLLVLYELQEINPDVKQIIEIGLRSFELDDPEEQVKVAHEIKSIAAKKPQNETWWDSIKKQKDDVVSLIVSILKGVLSGGVS